MRVTRKLLGQSLYNRLYREPVLTLNGSIITRQEMIEKFKCGNFAAARRLARAMKETGLTEIRGYGGLLTLAHQNGVGAVTLYVALCLMPPAAAKDIIQEAKETLATMERKQKKRQ